MQRAVTGEDTYAVTAREAEARVIGAGRPGGRRRHFPF